MTPEQRAAEAMRSASDAALAGGPPMHAWLTELLRAALVEARSVCSYLPDRDRISDLMIGAAAAVAEDPGTLECFVCGGSGRIGAVMCRGCNGVGRIGAPAELPVGDGILARKPCGCATDWIGGGIHPDDATKRRELWKNQGWREEPMTFEAARPLITEGAACAHDRRETERPQDPIANTFADLPPTPGA